MIINYSVNNKGGGGNGFSLESLGFLPFDTAIAYSIGQVVIYNNSLYKFTEWHRGEWDGDDVAETTVEELINEAGLSFEKLGFERFSIRGHYYVGDVVIYRDNSTGADVLLVALVNGAYAPENPDQFAETSVAELIKNSGGGSAEGAVRYDEAQDLTDLQQQQARENIGAAGVRFIVPLPITGTFEDLSEEDVKEIYEYASSGFNVIVGVGGRMHKVLDCRKEMVINYDDYIINLLNADGTIEEIRLRDYGLTRELTFTKLGAAENHQLLKSALSEAIGCPANTWHTLCEVTVPEDGVYQVSASVCAQPATETSYSAVIVGIATRTGSGNPTEHQEIRLPRSGEYGTMSVPVNATAGQKIQLLAYSSSNFYAQAAPSTGKASATFIAAVRIGAIYQE